MLLICLHAVQPRRPEITFTRNPALLGGSVTITCSSDGYPEPSYIIAHNGTRVGVENTFTISHVMWNDTGTYECLAKNFLGNYWVSTYLTVKGMTTCKRSTSLHLLFC